MRRKLLSHLTPRPLRVLVLAVMISLAFSTAAMAAPGDLDPTFSGDGKQTTDLGGGANAVAIQPDGKIVVVGASGDGNFALARYSPNGSLDQSFSGNGRQRTDFGGRDRANGVAIQADGKIVAVGLGGRREFALARYNPNGSLDRSFSGNGRQRTAFGRSAFANGVAIQADGKIVAAGTATGQFGDVDFALARYLPNGSLDRSFSGDGKQTTDFGADDVAKAVAVQANGKIVAVGVGRAFAEIGDFALARYNPNGSLDRSFSGDGKQTTSFAEFDEANGVAIQADGKIVAAGLAGPRPADADFGLARYNANGSLDRSFFGNGSLRTDFGGNDFANGVAIQADGKIVAAGATNGQSGIDFALARYNPNGSLDRSFSGDGRQTTNFAGFDEAKGVAIQQDGRIVAAGRSFGSDQVVKFALARYQAGAPELDQSFTSGRDSEGLINECCNFIAQTFTAGRSGTLAAVNVDVFNDDGRFTAPLRVSVRNTQGGLPGQTVLATTVVNSEDVPLSRLISFPQQPQIHSGVRYAIVVNLENPQGRDTAGWIGATGNRYARGDECASFNNGLDWFSYAQQGFDLHFRTYVVTPG